MNRRKAGLILKYGLVGVFASLLVFVLGAGFVYVKANADARNEVVQALEVVDKYVEKGLDSLDYKESKLIDYKDSLSTFISYKKLQYIREYALSAQGDIESEYKEELAEKKTLFELDFEAFEKDFIDTEAIEIEGRDDFEIKELEFQENLSKDYVYLGDLQEDLLSLEQTHGELLSQVDDAQKEMLKDNIVELEKESEELVAFFKMRGGYETEIRKVQEYKSKSNDLLTLEKYKDYSFNELNKVFEDQVYPLINEPKEKMLKISAEEKVKRQAWVDAEKKKWDGIGKTPPKVPFDDKYKQIYINIATQYLYAYEGGELIMSTPITSGMAGHETVRGKFAIYSKATNRHLRSPFPNISYDVVVDYWLPFYSGYGIHDSCNSYNCWRSVFGGSDYIWSGSHGCINTPHDKVAFLYGWAEIGTTVYID